MELVSDQYTIENIKKKTAAKGFKDFEEGDVLTFKVTLDIKTKGRGGVYATRVECENLTQEITVVKSQTRMVNLINRSFELV